jgi:hypothetical protein
LSLVLLLLVAGVEEEVEGAGREGAVLERRACRLSNAACSFVNENNTFFASCLLRKKPIEKYVVTRP